MVAYPALFEPAEEGGFVITFPDFGYGVTQAEDEAEAIEMASDLLSCLISDRIAADDDLPAVGSHRGRKYRKISPPALEGVKAELYSGFRAARMRKAELARRLGIPKSNVDRLFNLKHSSRFEQLEAAFRAIGKEIRIEVRDAA
jgi:antitoxin HicB